jgi:hypothetical protein
MVAKLPMAIDARLRPGGLVLERARIEQLQVLGDFTHLLQVCHSARLRNELRR